MLTIVQLGFNILKKETQIFKQDHLGLVGRKLKKAPGSIHVTATPIFLGKLIDINLSA